SVTGTGFVPINQAFNTTLESDLQRAEYVTLPVTLLLLVLIFASVIAAGLPLGIGILTIVGGIGGTFLLNHFTDVSQYAINIVTLIGLGVSIDYSLFIVNRFGTSWPPAPAARTRSRPRWPRPAARSRSPASQLPSACPRCFSSRARSWPRWAPRARSSWPSRCSTR